MKNDYLTIMAIICLFGFAVFSIGAITSWICLFEKCKEFSWSILIITTMGAIICLLHLINEFR